MSCKTPTEIDFCFRADFFAAIKTEARISKKLAIHHSPLATNLNYFNYFSEIEEAFNRRRGNYNFLSPLDWALIESWQEKGVPLHIVLRGIEKVFDGVDAKPNKRRTIKSLTYCREEIEAQYHEWLERQVGKNDAEDISAAANENDLFAGDSEREHLRRVISELTEAAQKAAVDLRETLERVSKRVSELEKNETDAETMEASLSELEKLIDEALLETADEKFLEQLRQQTTKNLAHYKNKMEQDVYRHTFDLMILKTLREQAEIPRLSLFYL